MRKLPIGIQTFEKLRDDNAIYVDKTRHIYNLITTGSVYFLSRPRRFGKSLLISTLKELFKGNKKLFEGLYIYDKWDWSKKSPVIHLDFAEIQYSSVEQLEISLENFLNDVAKHENIELEETPIRLIGVKFARLIEKLHKKTGEQVAILVDEYDKPLIDNLNNKEIYPKIKRTLHNFYQVIKASDEHLRFVFLTGVSRFSGLSIFSGLNNLNDITMNSKYISICGYTQEELENNFNEYIKLTAESLDVDYNKMIDMIKKWYNGYSWDGKIRVYNPFSTLLFFDNRRFANYWFTTGMPTFLIEQIRKRDDLEAFRGAEVVGENSLRGLDYDKIESTALLFQTGYLTVKKEESTEFGVQYTLDFPNMEVRNSFLTNLIEYYSNRESREINSLRLNIDKQIKERDEKGLEETLITLFAHIPYDLHISKESYYHSMFLMLMIAVGYEVEGEVHTDKGRIDAVLKKGNEVIIVEIKYGKENKVEQLLEEAIKQIKDRKYYEKYVSSEVSLLAIAFGDNKEIACKFQKLV